jgi:hypothetical protein
MPDNLPSMILFCLFMGLNALLLIRFAVKRFAPVKTVQAEVIHKQTVESFSKYKGNGKHVRHCVVFRANGKKLYFYVNQFSYGGYRVGEKGKLTYKGDRIIDFK